VVVSDARRQLVWSRCPPASPWPTRLANSMPSVGSRSIVEVAKARVPVSRDRRPGTARPGSNECATAAPTVTKPIRRYCFIPQMNEPFVRADTDPWHSDEARWEYDARASASPDMLTPFLPTDHEKPVDHVSFDPSRDDKEALKLRAERAFPATADGLISVLTIPLPRLYR